MMNFNKVISGLATGEPPKIIKTYFDANFHAFLTKRKEGLWPNAPLNTHLPIPHPGDIINKHFFCAPYIIIRKSEYTAAHEINCKTKVIQITTKLRIPQSRVVNWPTFAGPNPA